MQESAGCGHWESHWDRGGRQALEPSGLGSWQTEFQQFCLTWDPEKWALPSWEPLPLHLWFITPSTTEVTQAWLEHSENSITQEHLSRVQTGALPICMAPSGQRTLCAVLPNLFPKQGALPVLGLFCGRVQARIMCSLKHCWTQPSAPPSRRTNQSTWETAYPSHSPVYSSVWAENLISLPLCRAKPRPHVTKALGVQFFWFGSPVSGSRQPWCLQPCPGCEVNSQPCLLLDRVLSPAQLRSLAWESR